MENVSVLLAQNPRYSYIEDLKDWVGKHIRRTDIMWVGGEAIGAIQEGDVFQLVSVDEARMEMKRDGLTITVSTEYFADGGWEFAY